MLDRELTIGVGAALLTSSAILLVARHDDIAALDRDPALVEHGILERSGTTRGQISLDRRGVGPGRNHPKRNQWNGARPPFAAPPEKSVHSTSRGSGNREKTNPCGAVKPEITRPYSGARLTLPSAVSS